MAAGKHWAAGRRADAIAAFQEVVLLDPTRTPVTISASRFFVKDA
jgi:hypothetical protein